MHVVDEAKLILDSLKDNQHVRSKYRKVRSFIGRFKKLMKEVF